MTEDYREALRYLNGLVKEGLLSELTFTMPYTDIYSMVDVDGTDTDPFIGVVRAHTTTAWRVDSKSLLDYNYVPPLTGPNGKSYASYGPPSQNYNALITSHCETPEIALRFLDFLSDYETSITSRWGLQGDGWEFVDNPEAYTPAIPAEGLSVLYEIIKNPYSDSNNMIWKIGALHNTPSMIMSARPVVNEDSEVVAHRNTIYNGGIAAQIGKQPAQVMGKLLYTGEEADAIADIQTSIETYLKECQTRFILGDLDVEKDWDNYIEQLKTMKVDTWLATAQDAWDRMSANR